MQYNSKAVMPPLFLRCKSVSGPFLRMGEKWDLHGRHKGVTWELLGSYLLLMNSHTIYLLREREFDEKNAALGYVTCEA